MKFRNMQNQWLIQKIGIDTVRKMIYYRSPFSVKTLLLQQGNCDPVGAFEDLSLKLIRRL